MKLKLLLIGSVAACGLLPRSAQSFEFGYAGYAQKPGLVVGNGASNPPPGLYAFDQVFTYQAKLAGPGAPIIDGNATSVHAAAATAGLFWVPGWTIFGASYDAVIAQPWLMADLGDPININPAGLHNTFIAPIELSWKLGESGFYARAGLGLYAPTGATSGANGLGNVGTPWWVIQPNVQLSYLRDGWNLTANLFDEINTRNPLTGYRSGDILHAEFTATRTVGKWTVGPVAYYVGQISNDKSSSFYGGAINTNRYNVWAAGALVGYDFGPATLTVWATSEISASASGGTPISGSDPASISKGISLFANLSYRLWSPDAPATPSAGHHK
ncbi:hypothetical protein CWS35_28925 [Bradyrhizobium sp. SK17]|jgi:hypothetical protein|uniref:SphA family protein n=1 Tax=Bradyrhizobium sp. SK17 TaxID=2057741 RepID=UPI000C310734|nr:transporter [Bradyrhizobium sp. SK17]AUC97819.1 hypothetical protein CWS35_28925 [Bradyrhizobium sp. SK17]